MERVERALVILAKWPSIGHGKQRLAREVGPHRARDLARAFLADTLALADGGPHRLVIAFAPPSAARAIRRVAPAAVLAPQPRAPFGARLEAALAAGLGLARSVVLIGTDTPTLPRERLTDAFDALMHGADLVLGPSEDGGYYLIGCRGPLPRALFSSMPWSTPAVLAETTARAEAARIRMRSIGPWYDIDDAASLMRLRTDRGLEQAVHTSALLARSVVAA